MTGKRRGLRIALVYDRVYPWLIGGGEKSLAELADLLRDAGHEVHVFGMKLWNGPDRIVRDGVELHGVMPAPALYDERGNRVLLQPVRFGWHLLRYLNRLGLRFDVIDCTVFPYFSVLAVWLHGALTGTPVVLTWLEVWGREYWRAYLGSWWLAWPAFLVEWLAARSSPTQIVLSRLQGDRLVRLLGVHPDRVEVVGRGIHAGDTAPRQEVPGRVLHAGRLIPYKNVETVVKAFPRVRARLPEAHLRIIGDGPSLEAIGALIDRLGAGAYVEVVPPVASGDRILAELASAQVLVQPSLREGQGLIVLEAMQLGTPVVAARSASSAVVDVVEHEVNGLLVDRPLEPGSWADALVGLLHDRARRERLATAARATAAPFDWQVIVTRLLEVYRRACARG